MITRARADGVLAGIFVGGQSQRMGGRPKGLLIAPSGETIVARWRGMFDDLGVPTVLVGRASAYAGLGLETLDDEPPGIGPIGGLTALLARADGGRAIAVACDMPFVSAALLAKLVFHPAGPSAVAAKRAGVWEPLFARYEGRRPLDVAREHVALGRRSLFALLETLGAETLELTDGELDELDDWDAPPDADGGSPARGG